MIINDLKDVFVFSFAYFIKLIFNSKTYDVVFMSTSFFNREQKGENYLFSPLIKVFVLTIK